MLSPAQFGHIILVPAVETIVQPHFRAAAATPFAWSVCSWVTTTASIDSGAHSGHGETVLQNAGSEPGVDQYARARRLDQDGVAAAPTSQDPQIHQVLQRFLCASASCLRALSPSSTCRRAIARSATTRNLVTSYVS